MVSEPPSCPGCGRPMQIARYRCDDCNLNLDGQFELPPLAKLSVEEHVLVVAFLRYHGNITRMERLFGISYPTVKNRLNAIVEKLDAPMMVPEEPRSVLERLSAGEIDAKEALRRLEARP